MRQHYRIVAKRYDGSHYERCYNMDLWFNEGQYAINLAHHLTKEEAKEYLSDLYERIGGKEFNGERFSYTPDVKCSIEEGITLEKKDFEGLVGMLTENEVYELEEALEDECPDEYYNLYPEDVCELIGLDYTKVIMR